MEDRNDEFDSLLIKSNKSSSLKKILLIFAVLLLILILIILVTKSLVEPQNEVKPSIKLPPEPSSKEIGSENEPLFKQVPIVEESQEKEKIEDIVNKVKDSPKQADEKLPIVSTNESEIEPEKKPEKAKPVIQEKTSAKRVSNEQKPSPYTTAKNQTSLKKYYIQVGAFFKRAPKKSFLENIKKEGFNYIVIDAKKGEISYKKVLVGPFESKEDASKKLLTVKKRINQNAYITKVK